MGTFTVDQISEAGAVVCEYLAEHGEELPVEVGAGMIVLNITAMEALPLSPDKEETRAAIVKSLVDFFRPVLPALRLKTEPGLE